MPSPIVQVSASTLSSVYGIERRPARRSGTSVVSVDDVDAAVVVVDEHPELVHDRVADLAHVVQAVELAGEALQHLQVGDRADVPRPFPPGGTLACPAPRRGRPGSCRAPSRSSSRSRRRRPARAGSSRARGPGRCRSRRSAGPPGRTPSGERRSTIRAREPERVARVARGHDDAELLAAQAADDVGGAHDALAGCRPARRARGRRCRGRRCR